MIRASRVWGDVYLIGGSELSHPADCSVYLIDAGPLVLIDAGAGESFLELVRNIQGLGFDPEGIEAVVATHAHIDHIGALAQFRERFGARIVAHALDAPVIETGEGTGARRYGVPYRPCPVDVKLTSPEESLHYGRHELKVLHIPGHTPGSIALYLDLDKKRVLFGQDIHGPYYIRGADPGQAKASLQRLIELEADILCEGHFGIYQPKEAVMQYIGDYWRSL